MKRSVVFALILSFSCLTGKAQHAAGVHRIGIYAPLYLDSAFDASGEYRYPKNTLPKYFNTGLDFVEGVRMALDSLSREQAPLEVFFYDTRSGKESLSKQLSKAESDSLELIIAHCSSNDVMQFAEAGTRYNIPVINVNLPNDGGVTNNPFFVVLNTTLKTQIEGIYKYLQKYYPLQTLIVFRKKGVLEDRIRGYLDDAGKSASTLALKLKYADLTDSFTVKQLQAQLDSTKQTVCIAGTLDENFGKRLVAQLAQLRKSYPVTVMGMPTWDGVRDLNKPEMKGLEVIYGTPFYNPRTDKISTAISTFYSNKLFIRPSDMVFRGYEVTLKYAKLLLQYGHDLASNIGSKQYKVFTDMDVQPVLNRQNFTLDYFENKKLYFVKWMEGVIKTVN